jgi:hypothetical protein
MLNVEDHITTKHQSLVLLGSVAWVAACTVDCTSNVIAMRIPFQGSSSSIVRSWCAQMGTQKRQEINFSEGRAFEHKCLYICKLRFMTGESLLCIYPKALWKNSLEVSYGGCRATPWSPRLIIDHIIGHFGPKKIWSNRTRLERVHSSKPALIVLLCFCLGTDLAKIWEGAVGKFHSNPKERLLPQAC